MKNFRIRLRAILLTVALLLGVAVMITVGTNNASADTYQVDLSIPGLDVKFALGTISNAGPGTTFNVTGSATINETLAFTINDGVIVNWRAQLSGAIGPSTAFMVTINGGGNLYMYGGGHIINTGTGGTVNVIGDGLTLDLRNGGDIFAERSGSAVNIAASNVTINISAGGNISNTGTTSAVNITPQRSNVQINVNDGGRIVSVPNGNAINDSGGDTHITVTNGGVITAGAARAIWSQGMESRSTVMVNGGIVVNAAGNNLNPAIDMSGVQGNLEGGNWNVVVKDAGVARSTSLTGYALQTRGNVLVSDNAQVMSTNGRAINLVGADSHATIRGNATVSAVGTGTAISSATTNPQELPNTRVTVEGGTVSAVSGDAIRVTGVSSRVDVLGGIVSSESGNAINADTGLLLANPASNPYASFSIIVSGGLVRSNTSYAIQNLGGGANSRVIVSDNAGGTGGNGGPGGQIARFSTGAAIRAPGGTVTVNGGFVFAYGTNVRNAISANAINWPGLPARNGQVGVWNAAAGRNHYVQGSYTDLSGYVGNPDDVQWYFNPRLGSGIFYRYGSTAGFLPASIFPSSEIMVTFDYALIFDSTTGDMYKDIGGNGTKGDTVTVGRNMFNPSAGAWWPKQRAGGGYDLNLSGFSWTTTSLNRSLTIIGVDDSNVTIYLNGNSTFDAQAVGGVGITIQNNLTININGSGTLTARGGRVNGIGLELSDVSALTLNMLETETSDYYESTVQEENSQYDDENDEEETGEPEENSNNEAEFEIEDSGEMPIELEELIEREELSDEGNESVELEISIFDVDIMSTNTHGNVIITNGVFVAQGGLRAVNWYGADDGVGQLLADTGGADLKYQWKWSRDFDGSESGEQEVQWNTGANSDFEFFYTDLYTRLAAVQTVNLKSVMQVGGIADLADSIAIELRFDAPIFNLDIEDISIINLSGVVHKGATLTGSGANWVIWLEDVQTQGEVRVEVGNQIVGFYVIGNTEVTEVYKGVSYQLTINSTVGGNTEGNVSDRYLPWFPINITAIADPGYHFVRWSVDGVELVEDDLISLATFEMPRNNVTITAIFEQNPPETHTLNVLPGEGGTVIGTFSGAYTAGYLVEIRAIANEGYHFVGWAIEGVEPEDGLESMFVTFSMPGNDVTLIAIFEENPFGTYTLNVLCSSGGTVSGTASGAYPMDYLVEVTATPNDGYYFIGWTVDGEGVEINGELSAVSMQFSMPPSIVTITANFEAVDEIEDEDEQRNNEEELPAEKSPQTGVEHNLIIPIVLLLAGTVIIITAEKYRKRKMR